MAGSSLLQQKRRTRVQTPINSSPARSGHSLNSLRQGRPTPTRKSVTTTTQSHAKKNKILMILGVLGLLTLFSFLLFGPILKIHSITCQTTTTDPCHEAVVAEFQQKIGHHIFATQFTEIVSKVQHAYPLYQTIHIKRVLPSSIEIIIEPSPVVYTIQIGEEKLNVNQAGILTSWHETSQQQPILIIQDQKISSLKIQEQLNMEYHSQLISLHQILQSTSFELGKVVIKNLSEVHINSQNKTLIVSMENLQNQLKIAEKILNYPLEEEWDTADLRFSKPILSNSIEIIDATVSATPTTDFSSDNNL